MSALFERTNSYYFRSVPAVRDLELRLIPFLYHETVDEFTDQAGVSRARFISKFYDNFATNWLNSATLQLTTNGSQPPWSSDGWSFTPIQLDQFENETLVQDADNLSFKPTTKVSVTTPAIRGRIECTPYKDLGNTSAWLTQWDRSSTSWWNTSTYPHNIKTLYELGLRDDSYNSWGMNSHFFDTTILADGTQPMCCSNGTTWPPKGSALGHWSPPRAGNTWNFTTKWIQGDLMTESMNGDFPLPESEKHRMYVSIPSAQALERSPIIERASASVTVDRVSGQVVDFTITEEPVNASEAWMDNFKADYRFRSNDYREEEFGPWNVTAR